MKVGALHHLAIKTTGVARLVEFYQEVLGLEEDRRFTDPRGLRSVWLVLGTGRLMIERAEAEGPSAGERPFAEDRPGLHLVAVGIPAEAREAWRAHLVARGHGIEHETEYTIYTRDPDGNRVGLSTLDLCR